MLITLSFVPVLAAEIRQVRSAMKTRGATSLYKPAVLYRAFLIPLIVRLVNISDTLTLSLDGILGLNDFDSVLQAKAEYALSDHITLSVEGDFFNEGKNTGTYGRFKDLSCLILGGKFSF